MKKFIHNVAELKFMIAIYFMSVMLLGSLGGYLSGFHEFSFITIWQIFGMTIVFGCIHYIHFLKIDVRIRTAIHCVASYATVLAFSILCDWGFQQSTWDFWKFTGVFLAAYIFISIAFVVYYKNENEYLNKQLEEYKKENE